MSFANAVQTLGEDFDVVVAIDVLPDVLDDLRGWLSGVARRLFDLEVGNVFEIAEERPVEAVEHDELGFVDVVAAARAASEHLLPQDARLHRPQEHDELQRWNVHAGRKHIDGDDNLRIRAIAELANALKRAIDIGIAR